MPTLTIKTVFDNSDILVANNELLSNALLQTQHSIAQLCSGKKTCGKCRVFASGNLSPISHEEKIHLTQQEIMQGVRLACCTKILGDATVTINTNISDQICNEGIMPQFQRKPLFSLYGVAIDIGTTTLAAQLYNAVGIMASVSRLNPQNVYGADVISRIEKAMTGYSHQLAESVCNALANMIMQLSEKASINVTSIDTVVITGNTAMLYLLTKSDPKCLSRAPFKAHKLFGESTNAESLGLPCVGAKVYFPRCISAFVGADITTALLSSDICSTNKTAILVDIGTNGEIALWHNGLLTCCSTAAGPAFEGAGISMGMSGKNGAIDHVEIKENKLCVNVIGKVEPVGICGSGIVDAVACLLQLKILDEYGAINSDKAVIADPVYMSKKDIRMVQLAKSAICAGIKTLLKIKNISFDEVHCFAIAGGFGSYLNTENAGKIELIPKEFCKIATPLGNAALMGAAMILLNNDFLQKSSKLAESATTVELSANNIFMDLYVEGMLFNQ